MKIANADDKYLEKEIEIEEAYIRYRGKIIHWFAKVELQIDILICSYFCEDHNRALELQFRLISDQVIFDAKYKTLAFIVKNHYSEFETKYPKFLSKIKSMQETRNIAAHHNFISLWGALNHEVKSEVFFEKFTAKDHKRKIQTTKMNDEICNEYVLKCRETREILNSLLIHIIQNRK